jgi:hypothetical protein
LGAFLLAEQPLKFGKKFGKTNREHSRISGKVALAGAQWR